MELSDTTEAIDDAREDIERGGGVGFGVGFVSVFNVFAFLATIRDSPKSN